MNEISFEKETGINREGMVIKGSRIVPLLMLGLVMLIFSSVGIDWTINPDIDQLFLIDKGGIKDVKALVDKLKSPGKEDYLSIYVREQFEEKTREKLGKTTHLQKQEDLLIDGLNKIIKNGKSIYTPERFPKGLGDEIDKMKNKIDKEGGNPVLLNRLLLESAYPEINKIEESDWLTKAFFTIFGGILQTVLEEHRTDLPLVIKSQAKTIGILTLCSLIPGLAGLIYRRAFWTWFLATFAILFLINWMFARFGWGYIGADDADNIKNYTFYLKIEALLILLLLLYKLCRHSVTGIDLRTKLKNIILAIILILLAVVWFYKMENLNMLEVCGAVILLRVGYVILKQSLGTSTGEGAQGKNIVVCLDGTWNQPGQRDFGYLAETNVFKLYKMLKGAASRKPYNASQCKEYLDDKRAARQIAFYYNGVGNTVENSQLGQFFGGAFGMGADAIVERAYLDVMNVYRPGDRIFIFGFSRGAAIARLLADVIGRRGFPISLWSLHFFGNYWTIWKSSKKIHHPRTTDRVAKGFRSEDVLIDVLGCWDTVGAFGIPKNILGIPFQKINLLKDLTVSLCVKRAYHMVSLDETRDAFEPTLMDPDPTVPHRIIEVWFSGNHANVGGGYATDRLSNVTLELMLRHVSSGYAWNERTEPGDESWGLYLNAVKKGLDINGNGKDTMVIDPDPRGSIRHSTGVAYSHAPRKLPTHAVIHDSVFERMKDALPVYAPQSLFNLNEELLNKRGEIGTNAKKLAKTHSLKEEECNRIRNWSNEKLSMVKWSEYLEWKLDDRSQLQDKIKPSEELFNPPKTIKPKEIAVC